MIFIRDQRVLFYHVLAGHTSTSCPINMEGRKTSDRIAHRKEQLSKELI